MAKLPYLVLQAPCQAPYARTYQFWILRRFRTPPWAPFRFSAESFPRRCADAVRWQEPGVFVAAASQKDERKCRALLAHKAPVVNHDTDDTWKKTHEFTTFLQWQSRGDYDDDMVSPNISPCKSWNLACFVVSKSDCSILFQDFNRMDDKESLGCLPLCLSTFWFRGSDLHICCRTRNNERLYTFASWKRCQRSFLRVDLSVLVDVWAWCKMDQNMDMDQYLLIQFLVGWTSIYQLFWCSPGVQGFDTLPYIKMVMTCHDPENRSPCFAGVEARQAVWVFRFGCRLPFWSLRRYGVSTGPVACVPLSASDRDRSVMTMLSPPCCLALHVVSNPQRRVEPLKRWNQQNELN